MFNIYMHFFSIIISGALAKYYISVKQYYLLTF